MQKNSAQPNPGMVEYACNYLHQVILDAAIDPEKYQNNTANPNYFYQYEIPVPQEDVDKNILPPNAKDAGLRDKILKIIQNAIYQECNTRDATREHPRSDLKDKRADLIIQRDDLRALGEKAWPAITRRARELARDAVITSKQSQRSR